MKNGGEAWGMRKTCGIHAERDSWATSSSSRSSSLHRIRVDIIMLTEINIWSTVLTECYREFFHAGHYTTRATFMTSDTRRIFRNFFHLRLFI
jgi:hypothetical protein